MSTDFSLFSETGYQRAGLREVVVEMHIGIADWERRPECKQRVVVNVDMYRVLPETPARSIDDCINYDPIHEHIVREWPNRPHTDLLETLADELLALCLADPKVAAVRVELEKPDVYKDTAAARVEVFKRRPTTA